MASVIYVPRGKAREYSGLAANLYRGCGHGCKYCYAPAATHRSLEEFHDPAPREKLLERLRKEAHKFAGHGAVLLCFTCDPYQPIEENHVITRRAIEILHEAGVPVTILTKGGRRAERDFDLLGPEDSIGATLTFVKDHDSLAWEPGAALPGERIAMLKHAKGHGLRTWVSIEPVIDPEQSLRSIEMSAEFVDEFKIGKLNYLRRDIDWHDFGQRAIMLLESLGKNYYIKRDLQLAMSRK